MPVGQQQFAINGLIWSVNPSSMPGKSRALGQSEHDCSFLRHITIKLSTTLHIISNLLLCCNLSGHYSLLPCSVAWDAVLKQLWLLKLQCTTTLLLHLL